MSESRSPSPDEGAENVHTGRELRDKAIRIVDHHTNSGPLFDRVNVSVTISHSTDAGPARLNAAIDGARRDGELVQIGGKLGRPTAETFRVGLNAPDEAAVRETLLMETESDAPFRETRPRVVAALNELLSEVRDEGDAGGDRSDE